MFSVAAFVLMPLLLRSPPSSQGLAWTDTAWGGLQKGQATAKPEPVFARLEIQEANDVKEAVPARK